MKIVPHQDTDTFANKINIIIGDMHIRNEVKKYEAKMAELFKNQPKVLKLIDDAIHANGILVEKPDYMCGELSTTNNRDGTIIKFNYQPYYGIEPLFTLFYHLGYIVSLNPYSEIKQALSNLNISLNANQGNERSYKRITATQKISNSDNFTITNHDLSQPFIQGYYNNYDSIVNINLKRLEDILTGIVSTLEDLLP